MKKKGSKKKAVSHKKSKGFFLFFTHNKVAPAVLTLVFLALVIALPFFTTGNAVNSTITGHSFLDEPASIKFPNALNWIQIGNTWREVIVYIIVLAILFVILFDILSLASIFEPWVSGIIAGGFSIIAALTDIIRQISMWAITIASGAGIAAGFLEIIISIVIFVGLIFGSSRIAIFSAKRKAQREQIKAIKGAGDAGAAITGLKMIQKKFKYKP